MNLYDVTARLGRAALPVLVLAGLAVPAPVAAAAEPVALPTAGPTTGAAAAEYGAYSRDVPESARSTCDPADCVDAVAYGANGSDGRSDSASLAAAAGAAAAAGKVLWVPPGTYTLTQPFRPPTGLTLAGAGIDRTVLKLDWAFRAAFGYSYLIHARGTNGVRATDVTVRDLTMHGSRNESGCADNVYDDLKCKVNQAGGIGTGDRWTVQQVRFTNLNYFKLGLFGVNDVRVLHNRFDNDEAGVNSSGGEDHIGGGSGARGILIEGNRWAESAVGNAIDLTVASHVTTRGNESWKQSIIYEAVTDSSIVDNVLHGHYSGISVKPNSHYGEHSVPTYGVIQPRNVLVARNRIYDTAFAGIVLFYFPTEDFPAKVTADPAYRDRTTVAGGGNVIRDNVVMRTQGAGIVAFACRGAVYDTPDLIEGNTVTDVNWYAKPPFTSGCGQFPVPTGIAVSAGAGTVIGANTVTDTRTGPPMTSLAQPTSGPQTRHAVMVGSTNVHLMGSPNTAVASVTPQTVRGLTGTAVVWNVPVPASVTGRPDERGGSTVTVRGYGLELLDRTNAAAVTLGGLPATAGAPTAPDAAGLASMTVTVPAGTGTLPLVLRGRDGRTTSITAPVSYNRAPSAAADLLALPRDPVTTVVDVLANDTDPDGDPLTVTAVGEAALGAVAVRAGRVEYAPGTRLTAGATDSFTYKVADPLGRTATGSVRVEVAANGAPVAVADGLDLPHGTGPVPVDVLGNDTDPEGDALTVTAVGPATTGSADLVDGTVRYRPDATASGPTDATFTYTVSDGHGGSATGTATVHVAARPNGAPVAVADRLDLTHGAGPAPVDVLANDTDPDSDALTVTAVGPATAGTAALVDGRVSWTPPATRDAVTATFAYTVSDGRGGTATGTVTAQLAAAAPPQLSLRISAPSRATADFTVWVTGRSTAGGRGRTVLLVDGRQVAAADSGDAFFRVPVARLASGHHTVTAVYTADGRTVRSATTVHVAPPSRVKATVTSLSGTIRVAVRGLREGAHVASAVVRVDGVVVPATRTGSTLVVQRAQVTPGRHVVVVEVTDDHGAVSTTAPVTVTVPRQSSRQ